MTTTTPADAASFSAELRAQTTTDHRQAEGASVLRKLMAGRLSHAQIGDMLAQHLLVYRSLEAAAAASAEDPVVAPFLFTGLARTPALERDVTLLLGPGAADDLDARPATRDYLDRLAEASRWSGGLVAHHYTRYLGDLSGGLHIGRVVARQYPDIELAFYSFPEIAEPDALKDEYRAHLDRAPWTADERAQIIAEVRIAYDLNRRLLADLDAAPA